MRYFMVENNFCVYKHTAPNGKVYIGITCQVPSKRWMHGHGYDKNIYFKRAIEKYGWDSFSHEILVNGISREDACEKEISLIKKYKSNDPNYGFNITSGGDHYKVTDETRRKISISKKGKYLGIKNKNFGKHLSEETKKKISIANSGKNHPMYGKKFPKERREAISKALSGERNPMYGKHLSKETKEKISVASSGERNGFYGKSHTEETKLKMSLAKKGKKPSRKAILASVAKTSVKVRCKETGEIFGSIVEASIAKNAEKTSISRAINGINKTAGGYHWERAEQ